MQSVVTDKTMPPSPAAPSTSYSTAFKNAQNSNSMTTIAGDQLSKKHAIIIPANQSLTLTDYLNEISKVIPPSDILYASKISNNRICIYLSSEKLVDNACNSRFINTAVGPLPIRRLINPAFRLVLSNVMPNMTNKKLIEAVSQFVKVVSPMQLISAGLKDPKFQHIKSFRRETFILKDVNSHALPPSLLIPHDGEEVRIFLSVEDPRCFHCNYLTNHKTAECAKKLSSSTKNGTPSNVGSLADRLQKHQRASEQLVQEETSAGKHMDVETENLDTELRDTLSTNIKLSEMIPETNPTSSVHNPSQNTKVNSSSHASPPNVKPQDETTSKNPITYPLKPPSSNKQKLLDEENKLLYTAIKNVLQDNSEVKFTSSDLKKIFAETKNSKNPLEIVSVYTDDFEKLRDVLITIKSEKLNRNLKGRISRLIEAIEMNLDFPEESQLEIADDEMLSDFSSNCASPPPKS